MIWYENIKTKLFNLMKTGTKNPKVLWITFFSATCRFITIKVIFWHDLRVKWYVVVPLYAQMTKKRSDMSITSSKKSPWFTLTVLGFYRVFVVFGIKLYPKIVQFGWYMYMPWLYFSLYYENVCLIWYVPNVREEKSETASVASIFVNFIDF